MGFRAGADAGPAVGLTAEGRCCHRPLSGAHHQQSAVLQVFCLAALTCGDVGESGLWPRADLPFWIFEARARGWSGTDARACAERKQRLRYRALAIPRFALLASAWAEFGGEFCPGLHHVNRAEKDFSALPLERSSSVAGRTSDESEPCENGRVSGRHRFTQGQRGGPGCEGVHRLLPTTVSKGHPTRSARR